MTRERRALLLSAEERRALLGLLDEYRDAFDADLNPDADEETLVLRRLHQRLKGETS